MGNYGVCKKEGIVGFCTRSGWSTFLAPVVSCRAKFWVSLNYSGSWQSVLGSFFLSSWSNASQTPLVLLVMRFFGSN
jgi:hypothetical protein